MAKKSEAVAKKSEAAIDDDAYYDIKLAKPFEFPAGSRRYLNAGRRVSVKGKVLKLIPQENVVGSWKTS